MSINSFVKYIRYEKRFSPHTVLAYQQDLEQLRYILLLEAMMLYINIIMPLTVQDHLVLALLLQV